MLNGLSALGSAGSLPSRQIQHFGWSIVHSHIRALNRGVDEFE